jgi:putative endonuclease
MQRNTRQTTAKKPTKATSDAKAYFVYLLLCDDGSYYTGYTNNVASRFEVHRKGHGARYTRMHRPKKVVHVEEFKTRRAALKRERKIKTFTHKQKHALFSRSTSRETTQ